MVVTPLANGTHPATAYQPAQVTPEGQQVVDALGSVPTLPLTALNGVQGIAVLRVLGWVRRRWNDPAIASGAGPA